MTPAIPKSFIISSTLSFIQGNHLASVADSAIGSDPERYTPSSRNPMEETVHTPDWDEVHQQAQFNNDNNNHYEEEDPYEVFILRRPHERSSTVNPLLMKQPEMAETRLRFFRNYEQESNPSRIPCPFQFPTRPSMLETLTDDDDSFSTISRHHMGRRSFSLPSVSGSVTNIEPQSRERSSTDVAPRSNTNETSRKKSRGRKSGKNGNDDGSKARRRNTISMMGYPPNAKPPRHYAAGTPDASLPPKPPVYPTSPMDDNANRNESVARKSHSHHASPTPPKFATVSQLGGRKISAPAIYRKRKDGQNSSAPFALLVESPTPASPSRLPVVAPRPPTPPVPAARPVTPPVARPASPPVAVPRPATPPLVIERPVTPIPANVPQWPPHPSEGWPPKEPPIAKEVASSSKVRLREESALASVNLSAAELNLNQAAPQLPDRPARKKNRKGGSKRRKRRPVLYTSARLRTYLRTARGRERAATGAATRARYNRNNNEEDGAGRGRELSIVSAANAPSRSARKGNAGSGMRRVINFLSFAQPTCTGGSRPRKVD